MKVQNTKKIAKRVAPVECFRCYVHGHYANECKDGILKYKSSIQFAQKHGNLMHEAKEIKLDEIKLPQKEYKWNRHELESWMLPDCVYNDDASNYND